MNTFSITPIAYIRGCFPDKFGIPRQPSLAPHSTADIVFTEDYQDIDYIRGIEHASHLWLIFGFHHHLQSQHSPPSPLVRPQRLGGNSKMGVFATRSTYRPNGLGLSAVKLERVESNPLILKISAHDLCDHTPIFDIKPYIPFSDVRDAYSNFANEVPHLAQVEFSDQARLKLKTIYNQYPHLSQLIIEVISQDPRPPYHTRQSTAQENARIYGVRLYEFDIKFIVQYPAPSESYSFLIVDIKTI